MAKKPTVGDYRREIIHAYMSLVKRPITMNEVAEWALAHDLADVPVRSSSEADVATWREKLESAIAAGPDGEVIHG